MVKVVSTKVDEPTSSVSGGNPLMDLIGLAIMIIVLIVIAVIAIKIIRHFFVKKKDITDISDKVYKNIYEDCIDNANEKYFKRYLFGLIKIGNPIWVKSPLSNNLDNIGKYLGSCYGKDGFYYILVNSNKRRTLGIFPKQFIIQAKVGKGEIVTVKRDPETGKFKPVTLTMESSIIAEGDKGILITALGLERMGDFYFPVLMDKEGNPVYDRSYIMNSMQDRYTIEAMNYTLDNMAEGMDRAVRLSPDGTWIKRFKGETNIEQE